MRKHITFRVRTWPEDVPVEDQFIMRLGSQSAGLWQELADNKSYINDGFTEESLSLGDEWIALDEGELVIEKAKIILRIEDNNGGGDE